MGNARAKGVMFLINDSTVDTYWETNIRKAGYLRVMIYVISSFLIFNCNYPYISHHFKPTIFIKAKNISSILGSVGCVNLFFFLFFS